MTESTLRNYTATKVDKRSLCCYTPHLRKSRPLFATEKKMVSYNQLGVLWFDFPANQNVIRDLTGPKRGERVIVAVTESEEVAGPGQLRPEKKSGSMVRKLAF